MTDQPALKHQAPTAKEPAEPVYLEGYNDPTAQVVLQGSDGVALRVHDYYLKASSVFFREMLEAGTKGGPIPLEATSHQLRFLMNIAMGKTPTARTLRIIARQAPEKAVERDYEMLWSLIELDRIAWKYLLDQVSIHLRDIIVEDYIEDHAPLSLAYACQQTPPDEAIACNALAAFKNRMPAWMDDYFSSDSSGFSGHVSPTIDNMTGYFARELGAEGLLAYAKAMYRNVGDADSDAESESDSGGEGWDWDEVAQTFVELMGIEEQRVYIEDCESETDDETEAFSGSSEEV